MSSLNEDAAGRLSLDYNAGTPLTYFNVAVAADRRWVTVLQKGAIITIPLPSAAVCEKLAEMFARAGATWRDREQEEAQLNYRERIGGATK